MNLTGELISVVIPTYNRGGFIAETIRSVLRQENRNFELIIVDDGSTDDTELVVSAFSDSRIKYFKKENGERAAARNFGVLKALGGYVTFLDSDDLLKPNHLSEAVRTISAFNQIGIFHQGYDVVQPTGETLYPWRALPDPVNKKLAEGNFLSCLGVFARRELLIRHPFNEDRRLSGSEDYELWIRLAARYPIHTRSTVTAVLVNHNARSVLQINQASFLERITLAKTYLAQDVEVKNFYGIRQHAIFGYLDLYAALHLAIARQKRQGWVQISKAFLQWPLVLFNFRFVVVVKKLIFN